MEITAFEPRRKGFYQIYIDGEAAVKIDMQVFLLSGYMVGTEIDDEQLRELIEKSEKRRASEKALYLLEHRTHSKKELEQKIVRANISREAALAAAEHMEEIGLVNDETFATDYARMLFERKKYGKRRVKQELKHKGIDDNIIENVLFEYEDLNPAERAREVLDKKYRGYAEDEKVKRRAVAALTRLGYSYDDIRHAMKLDPEEEY